MGSLVNNPGRPSLAERVIAAALSAAYGDALGWPYEIRGRNSAELSREPGLDFLPWIRSASGRRSEPFDEPIQAGSYSDDTQLTLSTLRSLFYGDEWLTHFTQRELPIWLLYQRGGGSASIRAAQSWKKSTPPWRIQPPKSRTAYFQAGGNGVAMRILPHVAKDADSDDFSSLGFEIFANGVSTHGHPRALVGALAYGKALWLALRTKGTLEYGGLVQALLNSSRVWGAFPTRNPFPDWLENALESTSGGYERLWEATVDELVQKLTVAAEELAKGPLADAKLALSRLGAFDKKELGSGVIAAASSVYLASQFAANPRLALEESAFAVGADTDTLASMTGALIGAVHGKDGLPDNADRVQDAEYIESLFTKLIRNGVESSVPKKSKQPKPPTSARLSDTPVGQIVNLGDGRQATVIAHYPLVAKSSERSAASRSELKTTDGQSIFVIHRYSQKEVQKRATQTTLPLDHSSHSGKGVSITVGLEVNNLQASTNFYQLALGLKVLREYPRGRTFEGGLTLISRNSDAVGAEAGTTSRNFKMNISVPDLKSVQRRLTNRGIPIKQRTGEGEPFYIECQDPDGHLIRVSQAK